MHSTLDENTAVFDFTLKFANWPYTLLSLEEKNLCNISSDIGACNSIILYQFTILTLLRVTKWLYNIVLLDNSDFMEKMTKTETNLLNLCLGIINFDWSVQNLGSKHPSQSEWSFLSYCHQPVKHVHKKNSRRHCINQRNRTGHWTIITHKKAHWKSSFTHFFASSLSVVFRIIKSWSLFFWDINCCQLCMWHFVSTSTLFNLILLRIILVKHWIYLLVN